MKTLKNLIISIIVLIIIIISILVIMLIKNNNMNQNNIENSNKNEENINKQNNIQIIPVTDIKEIFNIENIIRVYFEDIYIAEAELEGANFDENITDYKILHKLNAENSDKMFYINNLYSLDINSKNKLYFTKGYLISKDINIINKKNIVKEEVFLTIILDIENNTFNITKYGEKYTNYIKYNKDIVNSELNKEKLIDLNENIEKNYFNTFLNNNITEEQVVRNLYEYYKINALYFPEDAYEMLDEQYKKERFKSFENYNKYLEIYRFVIEESVLSKYNINTTDEYTEYTIVDTFNNNYIIKIEFENMTYKIQLDNYTIKTEEYKKRYNNLSDRNKVSTNVSIFISMINTADYRHAYNLLDDSFKKNNFNTEKLFKNYINKNFFDYNIINIQNIKEQGNYYICNVILKNNSGNASTKKELTIIMQLREGTDFVMSFNIK